MPILRCKSWTKFSAPTSCGEQDSGHCRKSRQTTRSLEQWQRPKHSHSHVLGNTHCSSDQLHVRTERWIPGRDARNSSSHRDLWFSQSGDFAMRQRDECQRRVQESCTRERRERCHDLPQKQVIRATGSKAHRDEHSHTAFSNITQTQIETNTGVQHSAISSAIPFAVRYAGFVLSRFTVLPDGRTPFQYLLGTPYVSPLCMFGESVFALIPDHEVRGAKLTNRWISGCWWGRDASYEHSWRAVEPP